MQDTQKNSHSPFPVQDAEILAEKIVKEPAFSPVSKKLAVLMSLSDALKQAELGKKISRLEWGDRKVYGFFEKDVLHIMASDGKKHLWVLQVADIADDWILV